MTPQENAKELVNAMGISVSYGINYTGGDDIPMYKNQYAKECALIAIDKIIKVAYWQSVKDYWNEVKQEIQKL
jgi:hypothetical protein